MPIDLKQRLDAIKAKSDILVERFKQEQDSRYKAEQLLEEKNREISSLQGRIAELTREVELLKTARLTAPTRQDVEQSRLLLSNLVRDIDRCIADLTE